MGFVCDTSEDGPSLRGSTVKQDGPSASLTAPNGASQRMLLQRVSEMMQVTHDVVALEAHGTGTTLGDPVEIGAASVALRNSTVACTSVKGTLGTLGGRRSHRLEFAALISPVFYVECSSLHSRSINSHLKSLNLNVLFSNWPGKHRPSARVQLVGD